MATSDAGRNASANGVGAVCTHLSMHTGDPGTAGASEVTGGTPAYARKAAGTIAGAANGAVQLAATPPTFDIPPATTVTHWGAWNGSTYLTGGALTAPETFGGQGLYTLNNATYTVNNPA